MREAATIYPRPLQVDLLTLKLVPESRVMWATTVLILVFLGLAVLDLGPMYATDRRQTDRQTDARQHHRLMPPRAGHNNIRDTRSSQLLYAKTDRKLTRFRRIRLHQ